MTALFNWLSQIGAVTWFGLRTIVQRGGSSASAVVGIAGVVAVLVGVLSMAQGILSTMDNSAAPDTVVVLRSGANTEMMSGLSREETKIIADAPRVARGADGPLSSAELFVIINLPKRSTGTDANVPLRGVEPPAFLVRDNLKIVDGRRFERGRNEVIVGQAAAREFEGLDLGADLEVGRNTWRIVGVFTEGDGVSESEIWADAGVLQPAYQRGDSFQSVYAKLDSPDGFEEFKDALTTDPRVSLKIQSQADYYGEQSTILVTLISTLGTLIATLMAIGAVFGALNTMYTAVAARTREIATLRALGFGATPIVVSVMLESIVLALIGGVIGGGLAYVAFDGFRAATLNWSSFSQVAFAFDVTFTLLVIGVVWAAVIGLIGGLFPAIRAARMPVATALREQ
ncbi:MAG: ABC transporter permease [Acidobacteriota bacterium]|nr:ABC transporter permease [Acidobacteriota bacterium]